MNIACGYCKEKGGIAWHNRHQLIITDGKGKFHFTNVSGSECKKCNGVGLDVHSYYRVQAIYGIDDKKDLNRLIKRTVADNGIEKWVLTTDSLNVRPFDQLEHRLKKVNSK